MLRILTEQQGNTYKLSLHGRLAGQWVALLERYWRGIVEAVPSADVTTELCDVAFIDKDGERLLEEMWQRGTRLAVESGCMNRYVIEQIQRGSGAPPFKLARTRPERRRAGRRRA